MSFVNLNGFTDRTQIIKLVPIERQEENSVKLVSYSGFLLTLTAFALTNLSLGQPDKSAKSESKPSPLDKLKNDMEPRLFNLSRLPSQRLSRFTSAMRRQFGPAEADFHDENLQPILPNAPLQGQKIAILVPGYNSNDDDFDPLLKHLKANKITPYFFNYDDRVTLEFSTDRLVHALKKQHDSNHKEAITVIAHSMGGLIARKALTEERANSKENTTKINLVTISTPFAGVKEANGTMFLWLDLFGIHPSHRDLAALSNFVKFPGKLRQNVRHWKIETAEDVFVLTNPTVSQKEFVFRLRHQKHPEVDNDKSMMEHIELRSGHVQVLTDNGNLPDGTAQFISKALGTL
jgi:hypothetical protein